MQNRRNYYRVLHVQPDAPEEMIRACYRTLMGRLRQHPDLGGDHWNAVLINEAFATLKDRRRRAAYDKTLEELARRRRQEATAAAAPAPPTTAAAARAPMAPMTPMTPMTCVFCHTIHAAGDAKRPGATCVTCGSPLCAVEPVRPDGTARRALERLRKSMPVDVLVTWPQKTPFAAVCEDVSINGMLLTSDTEFALGERLRIECAFCLAVGVVAHRRRESTTPPPRWRVGVTFLTLRVPRGRGRIMSVDA